MACKVSLTAILALGPGHVEINFANNSGKRRMSFLKRNDSSNRGIFTAL